MMICRNIFLIFLTSSLLYGGNVDIEFLSNEAVLSKLSSLESGEIDLSSVTNGELDSFIQYIETKEPYEALYYEELLIECLTYRILKGENESSISTYLTSLKNSRKNVSTLINSIVQKYNLEITLDFSTKRKGYESLSLVSSKLENANSSLAVSSYLATEEMLRLKSDKLLAMKLMYIRGSDEFILEGLIEVSKSSEIVDLSDSELITIFMSKVKPTIKESMWGRSGKSGLKRIFKSKVATLNQ